MSSRTSREDGSPFPLLVSCGCAFKASDQLHGLDRLTEAGVISGLVLSYRATMFVCFCKMDYFTENWLHVVPITVTWDTDFKTQLLTLARGWNLPRTPLCTDSCDSTLAQSQKENFNFSSSCQILLITLISIFHWLPNGKWATYFCLDHVSYKFSKSGIVSLAKGERGLFSVNAAQMSKLELQSLDLSPP